MPKVPREVAGFVVLPVMFEANIYAHDVMHYIYLKPHEPRIPDEDTARSLFLVNIPVTTTEAHIRHLLTTQLQGGRIERVHFSTDSSMQSSVSVPSKSSKKRKRQDVGGLEAALDTYSLPSVFPSTVHPSGSSAIAVFIDGPSVTATVRAARRVAKSASTEPIVWGAGLDRSKLPALGLARYQAHQKMQFVPGDKLMSIVDNYMTTYSALEVARSTENAKKRQTVDEDGFITVIRGGRGVSKREDAEEALQKEKDKKEKRGGLDDFYRFQFREQRKQEQGEMVRRFEDDRQKVNEMRRRRSQGKD